MNDRAWDNLVDQLDERFGPIGVKNIDEALPDDQHLTRQIQRLEFSTKGHDFRVERISSPRVVEQKTFYHRTGQANQIKNVYDEAEQTHRVAFYKKSPVGEWVETEPEQFLK